MAFPSAEARLQRKQYIHSFGSSSKPNTHLTKSPKVHSLALNWNLSPSVIVDFNVVVEDMSSCFLTVETSEFLLFKKF